MRTIRHTKGFTLIELLVGLLVTSIILSAVATLAFALSSANRVSGDTAFKQTQLRHATLHVSELLRTCRLICAAPGTDLVVWRTDDNADNQINVNELVYIERGTDLDTLQLCRFSSGDNPQRTLAELALATTKAQLLASYDETYVSLIPECENVQFAFDKAPPLTRLLAVTFELTENDVVHEYQISSALHAWAGHLLNDAGNEIVPTDDD